MVHISLAVLNFALTTAVLLNFHTVCRGIAPSVSEGDLFLTFLCCRIVRVVAVVAFCMALVSPLTLVTTVVATVKHIVKRVTYLVAVALLIWRLACVEFWKRLLMFLER
jgi:hypothetical protein